MSTDVYADHGPPGAPEGAPKAGVPGAPPSAPPRVPVPRPKAGGHRVIKQCAAGALVPRQDSGAPRVTRSSRDGGPVPTVAPALRLAGLAEAHGWAARITYAMAEIPDRYFDNGNLAKAAHRISSAVVRLRRMESNSDVRGWAAWLAEDDGPWRFEAAYVALTRYGLRAGKTHASIHERIMSR